MTSVDFIELAAQRVAAMENIVIEHPRFIEAHKQMDMLVRHGLRNADGEKLCLALIAPSQTGKSTIIRHYVNRKNTPLALAEGRIPALHVTLKAPATRKSFVVDLLNKIGEFGCETDPGKFNESILLERARRYMKEKRVEILIVDEFHHLVLSENEKVARTVGEMMKWLLICGPCPIVMAGTEEAHGPFRANKQLVSRAITPVVLSPLDPSAEKDRTLFSRFLGEYLSAMENQKIIQDVNRLFDGNSPSVPACVLEVTKGVLGMTCRLLAEAVRVMTEDGRDELTREDLANATERFILAEKYHRNPFKDGLKPMKVAA